MSSNRLNDNMIDKMTKLDKPMKGTPKTLAEAIDNGLSAVVNLESSEVRNLLINQIEINVRDYLSQHFNVFMIKHDHDDGAVNALKVLWGRISKK